MERQPQGDVSLPPFMQWIKDQCLREGKAEGMREGKAEGMRAALLKLVARAGIALNDEQRARVESCRDLATLERWVDNALTAKTATELLG